ncbi:MAG: polysaccharide pyruvyl transferase family protein [Dyadobacter sp.]|uniref:polysaccharide pyruvyl transferase family protein n=1 Tax=Dyadobacter sp. TaxID=1914288 RepID=UPI001B169A8C|nr:polysaccharide pyruvyl transferase family protein [Dyadobacter sp.]MBO9616382.1 polysaccharide pyruvyl transferase family protein [Dyadobacter sp.]
MSSQQHRFLLLGVSYNSDNRGVNALGIGAATLLYKQYEDCKIDVLCVENGPWKSDYKFEYNGATKNIDVYYIRFRTLLTHVLRVRALSLFGKKDFDDPISQLILGARTVYNVNEGDSFSDIYGFRRQIRHVLDSYLALLLRKPLVFLPQTIGPFKTPTGKSLGSFILKRCKNVFVRDTKAISLLDEIDVKYQLFRDMAVVMQPKKVELAGLSPKTVGLNINGLMYFGSYAAMAGAYSSYKQFVHKLISELLKNGYPVLLIPHTYNADSPNTEDDLVASNQILKEFGNDKSISVIDKNYSAQELKYIVSQCYFFMGSRMHSCIAGLSSSVPTIGLAYSYKFEGTFANFGQQSRVINLSSLSSENIDATVNQILTLVGQRDQIQSELATSNAGEKNYPIL